MWGKRDACVVVIPFGNHNTADQMNSVFLYESVIYSIVTHSSHAVWIQKFQPVCKILTDMFGFVLFQALKMAHAGISLSEAEASVASPFTSKVRCRDTNRILSLYFS